MGELLRQVDHAGPWINTQRYSVPVYTVGPDQPTSEVRIVRDDGGWVDPALQAAFSTVPIPAAASYAPGTDRHLVVWQPSSDRMWEFWHMGRDGNGWTAAHGGAMENVSESPGYFDEGSWSGSKDWWGFSWWGISWSGSKDWWGATATSLPLVGGLMTIEELRAGSIDHALALAIPEPSPDHVWPAQRSDGFNGSPSAIPEGTIFRLPAGLDLDLLDLPPIVHTIAVAAQRHGMVVRDISGCVCLYAEDPAPSGANPYDEIFEGEYPNNLLAQFPWDRLQAIAP